MVNSMTGYGRAARTINGREIMVEIRAVNHRYFEVSARLPRAFSYLEENMKRQVQGCVSRGKLDMSLAVTNAEAPGAAVELDMKLAKSYAEAMARISAELGLPGEVNAGLIARMPDVFLVRREVPDEEQIWMDVGQVLREALERFCSMRAAEGQKLQADIEGRLAVIEGRLADIEAQSGDRLSRYRDRLAARMKAVLEESGIDEARILLEAAIYADKSAVDEETVRLRSHLSQFAGIFAAAEPVGRKLDFLVQEMNREINTIGSKAGDISITSAVVDVKAEIEKIREQIQNIE
jgi:uncharacterized protein (TIGR00255 family)